MPPKKRKTYKWDRKSMTKDKKKCCICKKT